jgi:t-SNARE complex subunit (syntaxin)
VCVRVLLQLFMDMAILVETQGDLIDQIEFSVMNSKAFTEKAVVTLQQTEKIVINTRKVHLSPFSLPRAYIDLHER